MKNIVVTGGSGFIGSNLCKRLLENENNRVICVDNLYSSDGSNVKELNSNSRFIFIHQDVRESYYDLVHRMLGQKVDEIYNLACPASPVAYQKDPLYTIDTSIKGVVTALEFCKNDGAKLLHTSTSEVYGDPSETPQIESYWGNVNPIGLRSCYDEGKRIAETILMDTYRQYKYRIKIVRIFNTYGPNMEINDGRVVSNFIVQALKGEPLTVYGSGGQTRSLCYVDDMIDGFFKMMDTDDEIVGPINLGNPTEMTISYIAKLVLDITGSKSKIDYYDLPSDDPKQRRPSLTLAQVILGYDVDKLTSAEEGIKRTIKYFRKKLEI